MAGQKKDLFSQIGNDILKVVVNRVVPKHTRSFVCSVRVEKREGRDSGILRFVSHPLLSRLYNDSSIRICKSFQ